MITHVAILHKGKIFSLPAPYRHHNVIKLISEQTGDRVHADSEQGFLDDQGRFFRRKPALVEAQRCQQLLSRATCSGGQLFSEDVW